MKTDREVLEASAKAFDEMADQLQDWANQSRSGGWSTHQVTENLDWEFKCRRRAGEIRRHLRGQP